MPKIIVFPFLETLNLMIMKRIAAVLAVLWCFCADVMAEPLTVRVMSINVRYDNKWDGDNGWVNRRDRVARAISFYDADIVGAQEVLANQLADLRERLPQYDMIGLGREDGVAKGEFEPLMFRRDRFELVDSGHFWLSATPEIKGSLGWDGACVRMASWARLRDRRTGRLLVAMNTHLDHEGPEARRMGARLLTERLMKIAGGNEVPVVLTGDFNSVPASEPVDIITDPASPSHLRSSRDAAALLYGPAWSFHDFGRIPYDKRELIDYVFVSPSAGVRSFGVLAETENDEFISDHCPVIANVTFE